MKKTLLMVVALLVALVLVTATLTGCGGKLDYAQGPLTCYSLYADYYWYEIADVICFGNQDALYYCFPKSAVSVAKTRMAVEELYKLKKRRRVPAAQNTPV